MAVQLLEQYGFGAAHGGAHASGGHVECGGDLGVAEAAVPEDERGRLLVRQAGERGADGAAFLAGDHEVGDVRGDGRAVVGDLLPGAATAAGAEQVQGGVGGGDGQPATGLVGRHRGAAEGEEDLLGDVLGLVAGAEDPGGDGDHAGVVTAEDLLEVRPDVDPSA